MLVSVVKRVRSFVQGELSSTAESVFACDSIWPGDKTARHGHLSEVRSKDG